MQSTPATPFDLQRQTLRLYGELVSRASSHGGRLVVTSGEGSSATGLPAAVSIAGGTSLVIDPDGLRVKSVFRQGGVDFVVNTLDEALRILKNEIRKHTPVSVALTAPTAPVIAEMMERGVQADLDVIFAPHGSPETPPDRQPLALERLHLVEAEGLIQPSATALQWLGSRGWSEQSFTPASIAELRELDARLLSFETLDSVRTHWLRRISQYQRPSIAAGRVVWLAASERSLPPL